MKILSSVLACIIVAWVAQPAFAKCAPTNYANPQANRIAAIVCQQKEQYGLRSVLVNARVGGKEILTQALGTSSAGVPATPEMHFRLGAPTETILITVLLRLVDRKKLALDDKLARWLPDLPHSKAITLRMLADSTAGYADYVYQKPLQDAVYNDPFRHWTPSRLIAYAMPKPLTNAPGAKFHYSHTNFVVLGMALEKLTGMPMSRLMEEYVFRPAGLSDTRYPRASEIQPPVLHAFTSERGKYEDSTYWSPSWTSFTGELTSNVRDVARWGETLGEGKLVSRSSYQAMVAPPRAAHATTPAIYFGMGVIVVANSWIFQNARFGGYNVIMAYLPQRKIALAISTTQNPQNSPDQSYALRIFKAIVDKVAPNHRIPAQYK